MTDKDLPLRDHVYDSDPVAQDEPSLVDYVEALRGYRNVIRTTLLLMVSAYAIVAIAGCLILPRERIGSIEVRMLFDGADKGQYPNGAKFNQMDLVAAPVLEEVFRANNLSRFGNYQDFKDSLFVQQSNPELDLLSREYDAKLSDVRLTTVDRLKIEDEFRRKRESLTDPRFAVSLRRHERLINMPRAMMEKVVEDTVAIWAKQAEDRKGVTKYQIPMLSSKILAGLDLDSDDYLVGIDTLRSKASLLLDIIGDAADPPASRTMSSLPGAHVVRVGPQGISLDDIRTRLDHIVRFTLDPLLGIVRDQGISKNPRVLGVYVAGQLFQARLNHQEAIKRVALLQDSLREYMAQRTVRVAEGKSGNAASTSAVEGPALIPQLSDSFLDRLVQMLGPTQGSEVLFRQQLTNKIIQESTRMVRLEHEMNYYEELASAIRGMGPKSGGSSDIVRLVRSKSAEAESEIAKAGDDLNLFYQELSRQTLNPASLYAITGPFVLQTQWSLSLTTIVLYGTLILMLSAIVVPIGCLLHYHLRRTGASSERAMRTIA